MTNTHEINHMIAFLALEWDVKDYKIRFRMTDEEIIAAYEAL